MNDSRLPKAVFYGELTEGKRLRGGQRLRYKDVVKRHLKATHITVDHWETLAQDRQQWRQAIHKGKATLKKRYHKNTNMITISAMAFLMLLPLSSSVSTAGEALNHKLDYSLTNEQST
jgi:predicted GTPase